MTHMEREKAIDICNNISESVSNRQHHNCMLCNINEPIFIINQQQTKGFTYNFCYFATLPEGLDSEGVEGPLHGDGIHLHHSVILTKHKQTLM